MGNCMERCAPKPAEAGGDGRDAKEGACKVKILLTRNELQRLVHQLEEKGGQRLEDVLVEMDKERGKVKGWKPTLESIVENPVTQKI